MTPEVRERVALELRDLEVKITALRTFLHTPTFRALAAPHRALLLHQHICMTEYRDLLEARLGLPPAFKPALY